VAAAARGSDVFLDAIGETSETRATAAALKALRRGGKAALLGGVSGDIPVNYQLALMRELTIIGSIWFPRRAAIDLLDLVASGVLDLSVTRPRTFGLDRVNDAVAAAASTAGGLDHVVVAP
jgi:alcohol dehydrogenase